MPAAFASSANFSRTTGMARDLGQRGVGADLEAAVGLLDAAQLGDAAEIDDDRRPLDAVLQPVEACRDRRP